MSATSQRQNAPVYSIGLPVWINATLRRGGVPVVELPTVAEVAGSLRGMEFAVLYDSRIPANREAAEMVSDVGARVFDLASMMSAWETRVEVDRDESTLCESLIETIQPQMEAAGFYWLRLGRCPYPFEHHRSPQPATALISHSTSTPIRPRPAPESAVDPFCWRADEQEFATWSRFRENVSFRCRSGNGHLTVEAEFSRSLFQPTLEIWRGAHVARIPLKPGRSRISAGMLVFQSTNQTPSPRVAVKETVEFDSMFCK